MARRAVCIQMPAEHQDLNEEQNQYIRDNQVYIIFQLEIITTQGQNITAMLMYWDMNTNPTRIKGLWLKVTFKTSLYTKKPGIQTKIYISRHHPSTVDHLLYTKTVGMYRLEGRNGGSTSRKRMRWFQDSFVLWSALWKSKQLWRIPIVLRDPGCWERNWKSWSYEEYIQCNLADFCHETVCQSRDMLLQSADHQKLGVWVSSDWTGECARPVFCVWQAFEWGRSALARTNHRVTDPAYIPNRSLVNKTLFSLGSHTYITKWNLDIPEFPILLHGSSGDRL